MALDLPVQRRGHGDPHRGGAVPDRAGDPARGRSSPTSRCTWPRRATAWPRTASATDLTTQDRERAYLGAVMHERGRGEGAPALRPRTGGCEVATTSSTTRRILELRKLARRRTRRSLVATAWSTVDHHRRDRRCSCTGRCRVGSSRRRPASPPSPSSRSAPACARSGSSAGSLHECSLFLDDVVEFVERTDRGRRRGRRPRGARRLRPARASTTSTSPIPGTTRPVLRDVSIEIGRAEVVAIVGSNGSGKTTLAKLLCGLYEPTVGPRPLGRRRRRVLRPGQRPPSHRGRVPGLRPLRAERPGEHRPRRPRAHGRRRGDPVARPRPRARDDAARPAPPGLRDAPQPRVRGRRRPVDRAVAAGRAGPGLPPRCAVPRARRAHRLARSPRRARALRGDARAPATTGPCS